MGTFSFVNILEWMFLMAGQSPHRKLEDLALICVLVYSKSGHTPPLRNTHCSENMTLTKQCLFALAKLRANGGTWCSMKDTKLRDHPHICWDVLHIILPSFSSTDFVSVLFFCYWTVMNNPFKQIGVVSACWCSEMFVLHKLI